MSLFLINQSLRWIAYLILSGHTKKMRPIRYADQWTDAFHTFTELHSISIHYSYLNFKVDLRISKCNKIYGNKPKNEVFSLKLGRTCNRYEESHMNGTANVSLKGTKQLINCLLCLLSRKRQSKEKYENHPFWRDLSPCWWYHRGKNIVPDPTHVPDAGLSTRIETALLTMLKLLKLEPFPCKGSPVKAIVLERNLINSVCLKLKHSSW